MELTLTREPGDTIAVACDGEPSHTFDLHAIPRDDPEERPPHDPVAYGQALFQLLFPQAAAARQALNADPDRIVLVTTDAELQAVAWEYLHGPDGFVVVDHAFVRGLPHDERVDAPNRGRPNHSATVDPKGKRMPTFQEAAHQILTQAGQPLHHREITERALEQGLVETSGKTPAATMSARLSVSVRQEDSPFVRVGRGVYGLKEWPEVEAEERPAPQPPPQRDYLSYKEAALRVLKEAGKPLHTTEITQRAIKADFINPQGLTPEATMAAQLCTDIKNNGATSAFRKVEPSTFGLAEWEKGVKGITRQAERQRRAVKQQILDALLVMDPTEFEELAGRLLAAMGYDNVTVTRRSADGGVDVLAEIQAGVLELRTAVQVKRMKGNVGRPVVSQLRGDMMTFADVDQGMIITTQDGS